MLLDERYQGEELVTTPAVGRRFLLWIDAVGGYLVCLGDEISLGQPGTGAAPDVPILADLSRRHAAIRREEESYLLTPLRPVRLDGQPVTAQIALHDGALIELGAVKLRFRRPHPLSNTARLEFVSHHRTQPSADAVLLMADSCVLGPQSNSHVVCPRWSDEVVLFRNRERLVCRRTGNFDIDGVERQGEGVLSDTSRVTADDLAFSLEPVGH